MGALQQILLAYSSGGGGTPTTWDPAKKGANVTLSSGNLVAQTKFADSVLATNGVTSGKIYWEILIGTQGAAFGIVGAATSAQDTSNGNLNAISYHANGTLDGGTSGASWAAGNVIGFAYEYGVTMTIYKNNVFSTSKSVSGVLYPAVGDNYGDATAFNFTLRPDAASQSYAPPTGFTPIG